MCAIFAQDFEEIFVALHGRRPTPAECAADQTYHALYVRYAATKLARAMEAAEEEACPSTGEAEEEEDAEMCAAAQQFSGESLWVRLFQDGAQLARKRPPAEWAAWEREAFPTRLHRGRNGMVDKACQTSPTESDHDSNAASQLSLSDPLSAESAFAHRTTCNNGSTLPMDT